MSKPEFTTGPWKIVRNHDLWLEISEGNGLTRTMIADCVHKKNVLGIDPKLQRDLS